MIAPLVLIAFALVVGSGGQRLLDRASWVQDSPRWGIWVWQALTLSVASAILLAGVTVAVPLLPLKSQLARLTEITPLAVDHHYETPAGPWLAYGALMFVVALAVRALGTIGLTLLLAARRRRSQLDSLLLVGRDHRDGFVVVEHSQPFVYCLPGRRSRVVVSSRALDLLSASELRLVLAHEQTHLHARHDLALAVSDGLRRTFGPIPLFHRAHDQISMLVEMQADDVARGQRDRRTMARALVTLTTGAPATGLAAGGTASIARVHRLARSTRRPLRARHSVGIGLVTVALLSTPVGLALAPAVEARTAHCCTVVDA